MKETLNYNAKTMILREQALADFMVVWDIDKVQ